MIVKSQKNYLQLRGKEAAIVKVCMYCYCKEQLFNFNFLDDDSDACTMESEDTDVNILTDINKVEEGINICKY